MQIKKLPADEEAEINRIADIKSLERALRFLSWYTNKMKKYLEENQPALVNVALVNGQWAPTNAPTLQNISPEASFSDVFYTACMDLAKNNKDILEEINDVYDT